MKKKNAVSDFASERNRFLLDNFRKAIAAQSKIAVKKAFRTTADAPAPRFWVSESRAAAVIGRMLAGEDVTAGMLPEKKEMYKELYARFLALRESRPGDSIGSLMFDAVNQPAPKTYMSWHRVQYIINLERRRRRLERRES